MNRSLRKGQLVKSKVGRDKDKYFLVYDWDDEFIYVVDGNSRRVQRPKKKNIRHLWYTNQYSDVINVRFEKGVKVTNADVRDALSNILNIEEVD